MSSQYNEFAGRSLDRLSALSDGVFAIVLTLLVLELHVPVSEAARHHRLLWADGAIESERVVWEALGEIGPHLLVWVMSFVTLGMFWVGQQTHLGQLERGDRDLTWLNLTFLLTISLMPFSTALLGEYIEFRTALAVYWLNLLLPGLMLLASLRYAERTGLLRPEVDAGTRSAFRRRIVRAQILYVVAVALGVFDTLISIGVLVVLQLASAIGPRTRLLRRF